MSCNRGLDRDKDGVACETARALCLAACAGVAALAPGATAAQPSVYVIDHAADGDTVALRNGQRVRLVQIDTPEVYFGTECYGRQASATTKRDCCYQKTLLPRRSVTASGAFEAASWKA
jgi:endonuclease YncB( thermonuclease family)